MTVYVLKISSFALIHSVQHVYHHTHSRFADENNQYLAHELMVHITNTIRCFLNIKWATISSANLFIYLEDQILLGLEVTYIL
jgi:hypothetical protein